MARRMSGRVHSDRFPPEDQYGDNLDHDDADDYDDDDYEEEERKPRRGRRSEPARTTRRRSRSEDTDDDDYDDDVDDEEDEPDTRRSRRTRTIRSESKERTTRQKRSSRGSGDREERKQDRRALHAANMKTYKEKVAESSLKYRRFDVEENKEYPIAFLEAEPFAHFFRHWVLVDGKRRPYVCLGDMCPLCEIGDRAKPVLMFNIYDFSDDQVKVWEMSKDPAKKVEKRYDALAKKKKKLNSPNIFFEVSKEKGDNSVIAYDVVQLPPEDLEDMGIEPLTRDELADLTDKFYDDSIVYIHNMSELQDVVDKVQD